jgi:hypothetical protein
MVSSPKGLGPEKDCTGKGQQHIQKADPSSRQRGRPTKQDRKCQAVINMWLWAPDGARHQDLLTDRQAQCDLDLDLENCREETSCHLVMRPLTSHNHIGLHGLLQG